MLLKLQHHAKVCWNSSLRAEGIRKDRGWTYRHLWRQKKNVAKGWYPQKIGAQTATPPACQSWPPLPQLSTLIDKLWPSFLDDLGHCHCQVFIPFPTLCQAKLSLWEEKMVFTGFSDAPKQRSIYRLSVLEFICPRNRSITLSEKMKYINNKQTNNKYWFLFAFLMHFHHHGGEHLFRPLSLLNIQPVGCIHHSSRCLWRPLRSL